MPTNPKLKLILAFHLPFSCMHFDRDDIFFSHRFLNSISSHMDSRLEITNRTYSSLKQCKMKSFSNGNSFFTSMKIDPLESSKLLLGSRNGGVFLFHLHAECSAPRLIATERIYATMNRHICTSIDWFYDSQIFFTADTNGQLTVWSGQSFVVCV